MVAEVDGCISGHMGKQPFQPGLSFNLRQGGKVLAILLQQVEGKEDDRLPPV